MVGAALLTAYHNAGGKVELWKALPEMYHRGKRFPEEPVVLGSLRSRDQYGDVSVDCYKSTPLAEKEWGLSNQMTARALKRLVKRGALAAVNGIPTCRS